jgi:hypothetical protein
MMRHATAPGAVHAGMIPPEGVHLAIEKVKGEAFSVRPGVRQMDGPGIAQLEVMAFANVAGRAQADDRHAGGNGRPDPACAVFNHETLIRVHAQFACGEQKKGTRAAENSRTLSVAFYVSGRHASPFGRSASARTPVITGDHRFPGRSLFRLQSR